MYAPGIESHPRRYAAAISAMFAAAATSATAHSAAGAPAAVQVFALVTTGLTALAAGPLLVEMELDARRCDRIEAEG